MARRKSRTLTELELKFMQVIWAEEEVGVEGLRDALGALGSPLALPSVRTMLGILQDKGYVSRRRVGRGYCYRARVPAQQAEGRILSDVIERVFDGSASQLVASLVTQGMVGQEELAAARKLIAQQKRKEKK